MTKIASDSEMRGKIMDMLIEKTNGDKEEMMKLVKFILSNPEMHKMILATNSGKAENRNIFIEPSRMMNAKVRKVFNAESMPKK